MRSIYIRPRNFQSRMRLKRIHHRNRKRQSLTRKRATFGGSRRGHHLRGEGWWPRLLCCMPGFAPGGDRAGGPSEGGGWPLLPGRQAGKRAVFGYRLPGDGSMRICRLERGARHRTAHDEKWCCVPSTSNAKTPKKVARNATVVRVALKTHGRRTAPTAVAYQSLVSDQLAATVRPLRASSAATRSTSASAAVRLSVRHLLSIAGRPKA